MFNTYQYNFYLFKKSSVNCEKLFVYPKSRVELFRKQLVEAEKQLASSQQNHQTLVEEEHKCSEEHKICAVKTEELIKCRDFYKGELDKTRSVEPVAFKAEGKSRRFVFVTRRGVVVSSGTRHSQTNQRLFQKESNWRKGFETCFG